MIGAAGHVGLGLSLVLADAGYRVVGIDTNRRANDEIMSGRMPFLEAGGEEYLARALSRQLLHMTESADAIRESQTVIIVLGTPVDENLNPSFKPLFTVIENAVIPNLQPQQLILLRSTVSPGTTEQVKELIESRTEAQAGKEFYLAYAPERVLQTRAIEEIQRLPQLIGAFDADSERRAKDFFLTFIRGECLFLTPLEAEMAKLITNMARYVEFALANEFYLLAESYGANIHRILDAATKDYPRLRVPSPGPNVGGPCLYKDGFFLLEAIPFPELISTAFKINEGMTMNIVRSLQSLPGIRKVGVLGLTFKPECDDTRNSLSFKLLKQLRRYGFEACAVDPHVNGSTDLAVLRNCDAVVLMTPHKAFRDFPAILGAVQNSNCWVVDIWGFWREMRHQSRNGVFQASEFVLATKGVVSAGIP